MTAWTPPTETPPGKLLFRCIYGSHAHGTATPTSDEDWRGFYQLPTDDFLGIESPNTTWERKPDQVFWEVGHFGRLLLAGNPNIVGLMFAPASCVTDDSDVARAFRALGPRLITKRMVSAYIGWAMTELRNGPDKLTPKRLSHVPRLLWEVIGALTTGAIPVRLPPPQLGVVRGIKEGAIGYDVARKTIDGLVLKAQALWADAHLSEPPTAEVNAIVLAARHGELA